MKNDIVYLSDLTNDEICLKIEESLIDYLRIISANGARPFTLNEKIGWVRTFPTAWSNYILCKSG